MEGELIIEYKAMAIPNDIFVKEFDFGQLRDIVIDRATNKAFEMLMKEILKNV